jgi:hypothetical protein
VDPDTKPTLLSLPYPLDLRIARLVNITSEWWHLDPAAIVLWDLDHKTVTGASLVLDAVSRDLRWTYGTQFWEENCHCIKMSRHRNHTNFDSFHLLDRFLNVHEHNWRS